MKRVVFVYVTVINVFGDFCSEYAQRNELLRSQWSNTGDTSQNVPV